MNFRGPPADAGQARRLDPTSAASLAYMYAKTPAVLPVNHAAIRSYAAHPVEWSRLAKNYNRV